MVPLTNHQCYRTLMPTPMALHDYKSHVAPHLNCLSLWNAMVPLMMLLASCDTDASENGIKLPKVMLQLISIVLTYAVQWCN